MFILLSLLFTQQIHTYFIACYLRLHCLIIKEPHVLCLSVFNYLFNFKFKFISYFLYNNIGDIYIIIYQNTKNCIILY